MKINFNINWQGIEFAIITIGGQSWRIASLDAGWQARVPELIAAGSWQDDLGAENTWVAPAGSTPQPLITMCCGLGSVWPGMGRELYVTFPAAAKAMDKIASLADWDVLGLMDENGLEKISQTRWQIPYLFMLEYAQWSILKALGINPTAFCGHSLGELIALCLAGVYSVDSAWYLLETRAEHMADLEAKSHRSEGMLAVPAEYAEIATILEKWPDLRISNRNTERQFIIGGDREHLLEARRLLRRKRVPAIMLNMDLAFHNPAMRILRSISYRRLTGLVMRPSHAPVLSCVDALPYPGGKEAICSRIADLDENTVDWVKLVNAIRQQYPDAVFLEIGPQETLCGLVHELAPGHLCLPVDKKGHEAMAMRQACAQLFSHGFFSKAAILSLSGSGGESGTGRCYAPAPDKEEAGDIWLAEVPESEKNMVLELVAEAAARPVDEIGLQMDLRQDLAVRSSHFPFLMLEAEKRLQRPIVWENLFRVVTVADLVRFLTTSVEAQAADASHEPRELFVASRRAVERYSFDNGPNLEIALLNPSPNPGSGTATIYAMVRDRELAPYILQGLTVQGYNVQTVENQGILADSEDNCGHVVILEPRKTGDREYGVIARQLLDLASLPGWVYVAQRFLIRDSDAAWPIELGQWLEEIKKALHGINEKVRFLAIIDGTIPNQNRNESADLFALEIMLGKEKLVVWDRLEGARTAWPYYRSAPVFQNIIPSLAGGSDGDGSIFYGMFQYSCYASPDLCLHGSNAMFSPLAQYHPADGLIMGAWVPLGQILATMCEASTIAAPGFTPIGFIDIQIFRFPSVSWGITRECRLKTSARLFLNVEGVDVRQVRVNMEVAAIAPNGRKLAQWLPLSDCRCMLGTSDATVPAIWEDRRQCVVEESAAYLPMFYEVMGMQGPWQMLESFGAMNDMAAAQLRTAPQTRAKRFLNPVFYLMDAALLGAMAKIGFGSVDAKALSEALGQWRFTAIGFVRFNSTLLSNWPVGTIRMEWKVSWRSPRLVRYDAQVRVNHELIMTIQNLEFEYLPPKE